MTAQEMWARFTHHHPEAADSPWEAWAYGDDPDLLAALTRTGIKTATSSAFALYGNEEPLPTAGEYSVILDSRGEAVCIIRTEQVTVVPFDAVDAAHAFREGEGDRSLPYWRQVHERFFRAAMAEAGRPFSPTMDVVCEIFKVVYQ